MEVQKRKLEVNLSTLGTGVILFGLWTFIKYALSYVLFGTEFDEAVTAEKLLILNIITWGFVVIALLIQCYIGFSARAEGKGKHKGIFYLILTAIELLLSAISVAIEIAVLFTYHSEIFSLIVTLVIDVTSMVFLAEVLIYSVKLRRLRKAQADKGGSKA